MKRIVLGFIVGMAVSLASVKAGVFVPVAPPVEKPSAEIVRNITLKAGQSWSCTWPGDSDSYTAGAGETARVFYRGGIEVQ